MHDCALAIHWRYTSTTRKYFFFLSRISPPRPPGWSWIRIFVWRKVTIERPKYLWVAIFLIAGRNIGRISCFTSENKWFNVKPLCLLDPPANSQARPISQWERLKILMNSALGEQTMGRAGKSKNGQNIRWPDHTAQANMRDEKGKERNKRRCTMELKILFVLHLLWYWNLLCWETGSSKKKN